MNTKELHTPGKAVSAAPLFRSELGNATAIQILKGQKLKEHSTQTPALLICIEGKAVFENANGIKETLLSGDYINIEPRVTHWVDAIVDSQFVLIK